jgi:hypothetical protein
MKMKNVDELLDRIRKISAKCDGTQTSNSPEWEEIKTLIDDIIISFAVSLGPAKWDKPDRKSIVEIESPSEMDALFDVITQFEIFGNRAEVETMIFNYFIFSGLTLMAIRLGETKEICKDLLSKAGIEI